MEHFRVFPRQAMCFRFIDLCRDVPSPEEEEEGGGEEYKKGVAIASHHPSSLHPFSFEHPTTGRRHFLATSYAEFWRRYEEMEPSRRHCYEVLREGEPCHLYFDLEFPARCNGDRDGDMMIESLLALVGDRFLEKHHVQLEREWVLELDSSTEQKFSRHLIITLPHGAFSSTASCGAFVKGLFDGVGEEREVNALLEDMFVRKEDGSETLFVDLAVYTRNRAFRLPFSSKAGKTVCLEPTRRLGYAEASRKETFMASLICNVSAEQRENLITFEEEEGENAQYTNNALAKNRRKTISSIDAETGKSTKSPYPELEELIIQTASLHGSKARIRAWTFFPEIFVMIYNISGNRFCHNVGREHKSNGVYYVVDFRSNVFYQRCHDPDCRCFRSEAVDIPVCLRIHEGEEGDQKEEEEEEEDVWGDWSEEWWAEASKTLDALEGGVEEDLDDEFWEKVICLADTAEREVAKGRVEPQGGKSEQPPQKGEEEEEEGKGKEGEEDFF